MAFPVNLDATWVNTGASYDAGELRRADAAAFGGAGSAFGVRGGVVPHGDTSLAVTVDGSDNVTIQAGAVVIPGDAVAGTGCYRSALPAATTHVLPTARHATNSRIDLIVFRQMDTDVVGSHGAYTARIDVVAGTPSATPAAPALPSMSVELARVTVPATGGGAASVDSSNRTYVGSVGGEVLVPSVSRLPAGAPKWTRARCLDTGAVHTKQASGSWRQEVFAQAAGETTVSMSGVASGGNVSVTVTFPTGRFTQPPIVVPTIAGFVTGSGFAVCKQADSVTTTQARLVVYNFGPVSMSFTNLPLAWHATQMTATSGAG